MKIINIIYLLVVLGLCSCSKNGVSFGTVEYYPSFLFVDANITPVEKTFVFDFSQDAKNDETSFAEFQFVDNQGDLISTSILSISIDGEKLKNNRFVVKSGEQSKKLVFAFNEEVDNGKYQGYLKLVKHNLDRIDNTIVSKGDVVDVFQWTLYFDKVMNPLAEVLMWILIAIVCVLLIWFMFMKPFLYPSFRKFSKSVLIQKDGSNIGQFNVNFKGARRVVIHNSIVKQSLFNRFFTGEIRSIKRNEFTEPLTFVPRKRGNAFVYGQGFFIKPNPIPRNGIATIVYNKEKITIILR